MNKNISKFSLSNYTLAIQIVIINFITAALVLIFLIFFNYSLLNSNKNIKIKTNEIEFQIKDIANYLSNNAVIRIPEFNEENCSRSINSFNDPKENSCGEIILSEPQLDPFSTQNYLISNYLNQENNIKIYNVDLIKYSDTNNLYLKEDVIEIDLKEESKKNNFFEKYREKYLIFFNRFQLSFNKKELSKSIYNYKGDISLVLETIKTEKNFSKIFEIEKNNLSLISVSPIINNNNIYGVILITGNLLIENSQSGINSFNSFNLFLVIMLLMFLISFYFSRSIVNPIKTLALIVKKEQNKFNKNHENILYPIRNDEIGDLSNEIKNMSKDLKMQITELENFAADVSHELKNPLASLKSSNELLIQNKIQNKDKGLLLKNIEKDIEQMNRLISDISNYTRTQAEIEEESFSKFDLVELIEELKNSFIINSKNINIDFKFLEKKVYINANREKLAQVFINIVNNSFSFSPANSKILIDLQSQKNYVIIYFVDQGPGIALDLSEKIFERFYSDRPSEIVSSDEFHSGLGLSISKKILDSFYGSINLSSYQPEGYKGACFEIKIPLKD